MNNNNEFSTELKNKLDEFQVEVPEISLKRSKFNRFANWIHSPAKDPLEALGVRGNSITKLIFYPLVLLIVLSLAPIFFI